MALASNALTTVADVKTYMGITSSTDDTLIETLVNNVSDQIERYCDREFKEKTFTEYLDGRGDRTIAVSNPPLISVDLVAFGARDSISVQSSDSTDLLATVGIEDDQARLFRYTSSGSAVTTSLTFTDYPTTTLLAAQINSTAGFTATSIFNAPSFSLHRLGGRDTIEATAYLTVPDDAESEYRIDYDRGLIRDLYVRAAVDVDRHGLDCLLSITDESLGLGSARDVCLERWTHLELLDTGAD